MNVYDEINGLKREVLKFRKILCCQSPEPIENFVTTDLTATADRFHNFAGNYLQLEGMSEFKILKSAIDEFDTTVELTMNFFGTEMITQGDSGMGKLNVSQGNILLEVQGMGGDYTSITMYDSDVAISGANSTLNFSLSGLQPGDKFDDVLVLQSGFLVKTVPKNEYLGISTTVPTSITDPVGEEGDMAYDDDYIYRKTSTGWKRSALSAF